MANPGAQEEGLLVGGEVLVQLGMPWWADRVA